MDEKESTGASFIPKDLLNIICILERDEKHSYKIIRNRNNVSLMAKFRAKNAESKLLKNNASVQQSQQVIRTRNNILPFKLRNKKRKRGKENVKQVFLCGTLYIVPYSRTQYHMNSLDIGIVSLTASKPAPACHSPLGWPLSHFSHHVILCFSHCNCRSFNFMIIYAHLCLNHTHFHQFLAVSRQRLPVIISNGLLRVKSRSRSIYTLYKCCI